jgi:hypothetical protein
MEDLEKVLTRWEGAVSAVERDGDDSPEALQELTDSRTALLALLKRALVADAELTRLKRDADAYSRIKFQDEPFTTGEMGQ